MSFSTPGAQLPSEPSVAVTPGGRAVTAWWRRHSSLVPKRDVAEAISTAAGRGTAPSVGLDSAGRAVVAWREDPVGGSGRFFKGAIRTAIG